MTTSNEHAVNTVGGFLKHLLAHANLDSRMQFAFDGDMSSHAMRADANPDDFVVAGVDLIYNKHEDSVVLVFKAKHSEEGQNGRA